MSSRPAAPSVAERAAEPPNADEFAAARVAPHFACERGSAERAAYPHLSIAGIGPRNKSFKRRQMSPEAGDGSERLTETGLRCFLENVEYCKSLCADTCRDALEAYDGAPNDAERRAALAKARMNCISAAERLAPKSGFGLITTRSQKDLFDEVYETLDDLDKLIDVIPNSGLKRQRRYSDSDDE